MYEFDDMEKTKLLDNKFKKASPFFETTSKTTFSHFLDTTPKISSSQTPIEINSKLLTAQNRSRLYWTNIEGIKGPKDKGIKLIDILDNIELENCLTSQKNLINLLTK